MAKKTGIVAGILVVGGAMVSTATFMATNDPEQIGNTAEKWRQVGRYGWEQTSGKAAATVGGAGALALLAGVMWWMRGRRSTETNANLLHDVATLPSLMFGETKTSWLRFWGNGVDTIAWTDVHCHVTNEDVRLPPQLRKFERAEVQRINQTGKHNSQMLALCKYDLRERADTEEPQLYLRFATTIYARYLAITLNEAGQEAKQDCLATWRPGEPLPSWLMQGVGVQIAVLTCDNRLICVDRSRTGTTPRAGELDIGAVEGLSKQLDVAGSSGSHFDLQQVFRRALLEEFAIGNEDITALELLALGYDASYSQVNFLGFARTSLSTEQVKTAWSNNAKSVFEFSGVFGVALNDDLEEVKAVLGKARIWSSGLACLYYTLVKLYGSKSVAKALVDFHVGEVSAPMV